jgi:aspartyl-tRNA(Asn)/glutamyl-tRNA(Gln) amidotransferase subunit A
MSTPYRFTRRSFLQGVAAGAAGVSLLGSDASGASGAPTSQRTNDLAMLTLTQAAELIRARQVSPVELTGAILDRIAALEPRVGAFVTVVPDLALQAAREAEREIVGGRYRGPLHGIPFGVKDTHYTKGVLTTVRTPMLSDFVPDWDATVVAKLQEAGGVLVGKTNLPEWSFGGETPGTHNPWNLAVTPGGSSGGSGAALAARMLPAATGGDTSGSIRGPAVMNGVVGMMPTYGRVSRTGVVPISWTLDRVGPMTRTVEDNAVLLNVLAGYDARDPGSANVPVPDYTRALGRGVAGLRVGIPEPHWLDRHHPEVLRAYEAALDVLRGLGANVQEVRLAPSWGVAGNAQRIIRISEATTYHRPYLLADPERYGYSNVRRDVEAGSLLTAQQYEQAQRVRRVFIEDCRQLFETIDVLATPGRPAPPGINLSEATNFDPAFNVNGFPQMAVPAGFSTDPAGLPLAIQLAAAPFQEETLYAVGQAYQQVTDWHTRVPTL